MQDLTCFMFTDKRNAYRLWKFLNKYEYTFAYAKYRKYGYAYGLKCGILIKLWIKLMYRPYACW